ncbi:hypothetical protein [Yersinia mollaretii]|uniref:hypothetical protein n=1 Tax=Yersinia mollaretii TaxID=33060 RepID=UPI0011A0607D|nr:hypothetical protein [Yersinia mollaretii]
MIKTITATQVKRDADGFWAHPDFFVPVNGNEFGAKGEFDAWKALNRVVGKLEWMECEENAEALQAVYDATEGNFSMWQPTPPAGDGWFMALIDDTEDGPACYWLRPIECDPDALAAHFDKCYTEAFKTERLIAERDAALNTCTLIAEALGITGAVAGDTLARVQQLVGEKASAIEAVRIFFNTTKALNDAEARGVDKFAKFLKEQAEALSSLGDDDIYYRLNAQSVTASRFAASLRGDL